MNNKTLLLLVSLTMTSPVLGATPITACLWSARETKNIHLEQLFESYQQNLISLPVYKMESAKAISSYPKIVKECWDEYGKDLADNPYKGQDND